MVETEGKNINDLPVEIFSSVLSFCLPLQPHVDSVDNWPDRDEGTPIQLVLASVCRDWHEIVHATPLLWCVLSITSLETPSRGLEYAREWIRRSGSLPLYVRLSYPGPIWELPVLESIIKILNEHALRWRVMDLHIPAICLQFLRFPSSTEVKLASKSMLHTFNFYSTTQNDTPTLFGDIGTALPRRVTLTKLHLRNVAFNWSSLTHFTASQFSGDECLELLLSAPLLTLADFTQSPIYVQSSSVTRFTHYSLQTLIIPHHPYENQRGFWDFVILPSLTTLRLSVYDNAATCTLMSLIRRSECQITSLTVAIHGQEDDLVDFIQDLPALTNLSISSPHIDSVLLQKMAETNHRSSDDFESFLPILRSFSLEGGLRHPPAWPLIASLPSSPGYCSETKPTVHSRPLTQIKLVLEMIDDGYDFFYVDEESLRTILVAMEAGAQVSIRRAGGWDFLYQSQEQHGIWTAEDVKPHQD